MKKANDSDADKAQKRKRDNDRTLCQNHGQATELDDCMLLTVNQPLSHPKPKLNIVKTNVVANQLTLF